MPSESLESGYCPYSVQKIALLLKKAHALRDVTSQTFAEVCMCKALYRVICDVDDEQHRKAAKLLLRMSCKAAAGGAGDQIDESRQHGWRLQRLKICSDAS
mmetsp:Transcript_20367/g.48515  ORF Transcript_20367/g.48515 Transcript_20367/m.48515 type:complete len:101 (-) Transcript_20367:33-335(-)